MVSVYGGGAMVGVDRSLAPYIPLRRVLKDGKTCAVVQWMEEEDVDVTWRAFNEMLDDGAAWPFEETFSRERYVAYFMSHAALCVKTAEGEVMGFFYVKPNFPGRCSHVCNGGFITVPAHRRKGVARVMGETYLQLAPDLGYTTSCFNLVFANNPSLGLWEALGFARAGRIPKAARLKGCDGLVDAYVMTYEFPSRQVEAKAEAETDATV